jgi:mannose-6-phosphate isomerase-like protein (cupin superfamily)
MGAYTRVNLKSDVQDPQPLPPRRRLPHAVRHTHSEQEEVYVVISGSARVAVDDEVSGANSSPTRGPCGARCA